MRHRRSRDDDYTEPWWKIEYGGAPVWFLIIGLAVLVGIGIVIVVHAT